MKLKYRGGRLIYALKDKSRQLIRISAYLDMYINSFNLNYRHWNFNKVGGGFGIRGRISNIIKYSNRIKPFHIRNSNKTYTKISYKSKFTDDLESLSIKRYL